MTLKIVIGVLCMANLVIFSCDPNKYMFSGIICGMLFSDLLWLTVRKGE